MLLKYSYLPPQELLQPPPLIAPQTNANLLKETVEEMIKPERLSFVGGAPLHLAIAEEDAPLASWLIEIGLDLNQTIRVQLFDFFAQ